MKKLLLSCIALCSLLGFTACGVEEPAEGSESESVEVQELSKAPGEGPIATAAGKWRVLEIRSCFNDFNQPCNSSVPSNQCPSALPNATCPTVGVTCNKVLAGTGYQILQCQ